MKLLDHIIKVRGGHYCHCIEVENTYDLQNIAESIVTEFINDFTQEEITEFLESLEVYYLGNDESEEEAVYNFSFTDYLTNNVY